MQFATDRGMIASEMAKLKNPEDYFGKDGMFARLFGQTLEKMVEAELTDSLGYAKHDSKGNNSGNSRNGSYKRNLHSSAGDVVIEVARDRNGEFEPEILKRYEQPTGEIEVKSTALYARGMTVRCRYPELAC